MNGEQKVETPQETQEPKANESLTSQQQKNLQDGYSGITSRTNPIEEALEDLNKETGEEQAQEKPQQQEEESQGIKLPDGKVISQDEYNNLLERAQAMQVLEGHPDVLDAAIEAIKGKQGELYKPAGNQEGKEEGDSVNEVYEKRMGNIESALAGIANHLALQNHASQHESPSDLQSEAQKILAEAPGLSVEQAVSFAKDRISARSNNGSAPPVVTSERSGGASNPNGSSIEDVIKDAQQKIKGAKTPHEAADTAIAEAIRIEALREEQRGG